MGFQQGLSGLNAASVQLDTIGNNVANASTVGFKSSRTEFGDLYGQTLYGITATTPGIGVQVQGITQNMTSGNIETTGRSLDLAINNSGFFIVQTPNGTQAYTRNGEFQVNNQGYIVGTSGNYLQGWTANAAGGISYGPVGKLQLTNTSISPVPTSKLSLAVQLNSNSTTPTGTGIPPYNNPAVSTSYNWSNNQTVYDSLGNSHQMVFYYTLTSQAATGNTWTVNAYVDGNQVTSTGTYPLTLGYNTNGLLSTVNGAAPGAVPLSFTIAPPNGSSASTSQTVNVNFANSTQIAQQSATLSATQDGIAPGTLQSINISSNGTIQASFSNSQTKTIGQVALANFVNPQGLQAMGGNLWSETNNSGTPTTNVPGTGNTGTLSAGQVEDSNVNLTNELVNMITTQRYYQANAQTVKTQDTLIQTLLNI
ncbi:flagellar hook protein FlgE [Chromobacterium amazonense]|uniref:Flagellar hook protein FlgE n=1 Tax=Chromobacterium amazonense TaxID=1382803 RepID=A0ABU8UZC2_9NEIS|nr:flagellar hook protein FlgE [Chromobacterium amazonense]MBM2884218.1 flagellar hook protein FlgE [Chromobacterium amazonense]MDQ4541908.1 flagellar hook protein FlgE [Chromobacterium amazonense]